VRQAVTELQRRHPWFRNVVRDLRMLRIEENDDLLSLLGQPDLPMDLPPRAPPSKRGLDSKFSLNRFAVDKKATDTTEQHQRFKELARELGCDEDEAAFEAALKKVAETPHQSKHEPKKRKAKG
jgi:hypothetical protein